MFRTTLFFLLLSFGSFSQTRKKVPTISYQNLLSCYPEISNEKLEFDMDLSVLKKTIDQKHPSLKSVLRYRKVLFTEAKRGPERHRLTISLQKWVKGNPTYDFYIERLNKDNIAEIVPTEKEKFKNILKDVPQKYLLDVTMLEDELLWLDTKPNKTEMSYKVSNDSVVELDLSHVNGKVQLKCENKKTQGVLCLCLKR